MSDRRIDEERKLHAYIDGELDADEQRAFLVELNADQEARERVCDLRNTKEWVKYSYEGLSAPTRELPPAMRWRTPIMRAAASVLVVITAFAAGWAGGNRQQSAPDILASVEKAVSNHVILHIGDAEPQHFAALLDKADQILQQHDRPDTRVEVIANAGGLTFLRTATSTYQDRIKAMISKYDNVRFFACANGLKRLRAQGMDVTLIPGVDSEKPAADHLMERMYDGWTYIRI